MSDDIDLETEGGRLKWARIRAGYDSATEFAKACGVNPTTYRAYENSQNGYGKLAASFARKAHVPVEWLLEGGDPPLGDAPIKPNPPVTMDKAPERPPVVGSGSIQLKRVDLGLSMGDGTNLDDYFEEEPFEFDAGLLSTITRAPPHRVIIARGDGDSMMPTLINDDMVAIDTTQTSLNRMDKIWAISLHGAGGIKRLNRLAGGKVEIASDNPTIPPKIADEADLIILGRVVWVGRRM